MSKETRERGERKREEIRQVVYNILCECVNRGDTIYKSCNIVNRHIDLMKSKTPPQERHLITSVMIEIRSDVVGFCNRMLTKQVTNTVNRIGKEVENEGFLQQV